MTPSSTLNSSHRARPLRHRCGAWSSLACLAVILGFLAGCGGKRTPGTTDVKVGDGSVRINAEFNVCPTLTVSAGPSVTRIGAHVAVAALASDDDPNDHVTFAWTATAGVFADAAASSTTYTCPGPDHAGPQTLTVSVSDGKCTVKQSVSVACFTVVDAGFPEDGGGGPGGIGGGGAGGTGGANGSGGAGGACPGDRTTCEGALCNQCTFGVQTGETDLCSSTPGGCANCDSTVISCEFLIHEGVSLPASDAERTRCQDLYVCVRDGKCVKGYDPTPCWCGTAEVGACQNGTAAANGPCLAQFIAAAGSSDPSVINQRFIDPGYPLGGAMSLAICRASFCGRSVDPTHPACPLW
jgi:hypothetical protein